MSSLKSLKAAENLDDLAALLGYRPSSLSFILYRLPSAAKYKNFQIPKKSGGVRDICAPTDQLKLLQRRLANILYLCRDEIDKESDLGSLSHGFRKRHSIVTNAKPHHGRRYVLNLDLKDFFPSFNFGRVRGYFIKSRDFALNEKVATLIAQIACHENGLPQGSPCSPVIADLLTHLLDVRLARMAKRERVTYSRYADDLTFSTNQKTFPAALAIPDVGDPTKWELGDELLSRITDAGFEVNPDKTRMQCRMSRQLVTGLTVNAKVNIRSDYYKRTRAMCDALFKTGEYGDPDVAKSLARAKGKAPVPTKTGVKSLGPLGGRLAHIHYVKDQIDLRKEIEKRKDKTTFRKLYLRFLFYRNFVVLDKPLILAEGKTDNVYLSLAVRHLKAFHPKLGEMTAKGFSNTLRFFNHANKTHKILELEGGSGNLKFFILRYGELMASFGHKPQAHPVIILIDNDDGAKPAFSSIKEKYGLEINLGSSDPFYHLTDNLYLVKTPHVGKKAKSCIEDLFEPSLLNTKLKGKTFNPNVTSTATEYGKHIFAEAVVRPNAGTIKWDGFEPLLQRVSAVLDHYKPPP